MNYCFIHPNGNLCDVQVPDGVMHMLAERARWIIGVSLGLLLLLSYYNWHEIARLTYRWRWPDEFLAGIGTALSIGIVIGFPYAAERIHHWLLRRAWLTARRQRRWLGTNYTYREDRDCKLHDQ